MPVNNKWKINAPGGTVVVTFQFVRNNLFSIK